MLERARRDGEPGRSVRRGRLRRHGHALLVDLDAGGELSVVRQNLETSSQRRSKRRASGSASSGGPSTRIEIDPRRTRSEDGCARAHVLRRAAARRRAVRAGSARVSAGSAAADQDRHGRGPAEPDRLGGLHAAAVGQAVPEADRLQGAREVRRLVGRDGDAHALRAAAASTTWSPRRATRACASSTASDVQPINPSTDPRLQELHRQPFKSPPHNTVDGKHYGISLQWGPNTLLYNTKQGEARADELGGDLRPEVQGQGHGPGQPDPDRRRRALPDEDAARPRDQGSVRAERRSSSTRRSTC